MQKSEAINELAAALAKARSQFKKVEKTNENPFFKSKYADLSNIIDATFKALSDNGLSIIQGASGLCIAEDGSGHAVGVTTTLLHQSGQWIEDRIFMPSVKIDAQAIGSATTYARRYAYQSMLNIAAESDDDGNGAVSQPFKKGKKAEVAEETDEQFDERTEGQRVVGPSIGQAFIDFASSKGIDKTALLTHTRGVAVADLTRNELEDLKLFVMANRKVPHNGTEMPQVASAGSGTPKGSSDTTVVSGPQLKRLFAICKAKNVDVAEVDQHIADEYGIEHKHNMSRKQYDEVVNWVESQ